MINIYLIIICIVTGIIFGIIGGALWLVIKIFLIQKKALKDYKKGKIIKVKLTKKIIKEEEEVPKPKNEIPIKDFNKSALSKLFRKRK
jgi:hypothetical protein